MKDNEIFEYNAFCIIGVRLNKSQEFARINANLSIFERLEKISKDPYLNMGRPYFADNGDLTIDAFNYIVDRSFPVVALSSAD